MTIINGQAAALLVAGSDGLSDLARVLSTCRDQALYDLLLTFF